MENSEVEKSEESLPTAGGGKLNFQADQGRVCSWKDKGIVFCWLLFAP